MKNFYHKLLLITLCLLCFSWITASSQTALAASLSVQLDKTSVRIGESVSGSVWLAPEGEAINTVGGELRLDSSLVTLEEVQTAGSIIELWITEPQAGSSRVEFSGVIPGGFSGLREVGTSEVNPGRLFTFTLRVESSGTNTVSVSQAETFSGRARRVSVDSSPATIHIRPVRAVTPESTDSGIEEDSLPPKQFTPAIFRPETTCDSPLFVDFQTTDQDTGIEGYQIAYSDDRPNNSLDDLDWQTATSPYELPDIQAGMWVVVKAIDQAGNEQIGTVEIKNSDVNPPYCQPVEDSDWLDWKKLVLLAIVVSLIFILYRRRQNDT